MNTENIKTIVKKQEFIENFSKKIEDSVLYTEPVELKAAGSAFRELNIKADNSDTSVWGLLIICIKTVYFFIPPSENYFTAMLLKTANKVTTDEQLVDFKNLKNLKLMLPRKTFISIFNSKHERTINAQFTPKNGGTELFSLLLTNEAYPVLKQIKSVLDE